MYRAEHTNILRFMNLEIIQRIQDLWLNLAFPKYK